MSALKCGEPLLICYENGILCVQGQKGIRPMESGSALLKFIEQDNKQATLSFSLFIICVIFEKMSLWRDF